MYDSLCELLEKNGWNGTGRVLEIRCGRGGGLAHVASRLRPTLAVGFDFSCIACAFY
jgi:cyclopropane fatty-acyl-phospholipid synthase-like methyltransferase